MLVRDTENDEEYYAISQGFLQIVPGGICASIDVLTCDDPAASPGVWHTTRERRLVQARHRSLTAEHFHCMCSRADLWL